MDDGTESFKNSQNPLTEFVVKFEVTSQLLIL